MGVYDFVLIEPDVNLPNYDLDKDQFKVSWQTRAFGDPMYRLHLISENGHLYRAKQDYEADGLHGDSGSFTLLEMIQDEEYSGYPREEFDIDWFRVRFVGDMRITAQADGDTMYDVVFERHNIDSIWEADPFTTNIERLDEGTEVYDRNDTSYVVVAVTDKKASEYIVNEEVTERGHTIYEEQTVADVNPEYPDDDIVVKIRPTDGEKTIPVPVSRIANNAYSALH